MRSDSLSLWSCTQGCHRTCVGQDLGTSSFGAEQQGVIDSLRHPSPVQPLVTVAAALVKADNDWRHDAFLDFVNGGPRVSFGLVHPVYRRAALCVMPNTSRRKLAMRP